MLKGTRQSSLPLWIRLCRGILRNWPLPRGRNWFYRTFMENYSGWPAFGDFAFEFGKMVNVGLAPWPVGYRNLLIYGTMDPNETRMWKKVLRSGDFVVDGGANQGYYAMLAGSRVGTTGRVIAVEAVTRTAQSLRRNIEESGFANIEVVCAALSDHEGEVAFHLYEGDPAWMKSTIGKHDDLKESSTEIVSTMRLDSLITGNGKPTLIKLDVEGSELAALHGSQNLLSGEDAPIITFEWNEFTAHASGYSPSAIIDYLNQFGFGCFLIENDKLVRFEARPGLSDWSPMVWAIRRESWHRDRFVGNDI